PLARELFLGLARAFKLFLFLASIVALTGCNTGAPQLAAIGSHASGAEDITAAHISQAAVVPSAALTPSSAREAQLPPKSRSPVRPSGPIQFTDVTEQAGIHFKHNSGAFGKKYLPEAMGSGVCFLDYDNDGWQDILFVNSMDWPEHKNGKSFSALYHNNHDGTFTDVTRAAGLAVEMYGMGCAIGDYNNDAYPDIYITTVGSNHLFHNEGKLDLFVSHYVDWSVAKDQYCSLDGKNKSYCTPQAYKGQSSSLFHNRGDGTFENVTKKAGLYDPSSKSLGIALVDYDNDGWLDLFVANDTEPNKLYRNNHNGTFTDVAVLSGVALSETGRARAGTGGDAGDYDGSGQQSLIIGNFTNESMSLYRNDGSGLYTDEAAASGIGQMSIQSLTFGCFFFD